FNHRLGVLAVLATPAFAMMGDKDEESIKHFRSGGDQARVFLRWSVEHDLFSSDSFGLKDVAAYGFPGTNRTVVMSRASHKSSRAARLNFGNRLAGQLRRIPSPRVRHLGQLHELVEHDLKGIKKFGSGS